MYYLVLILPIFLFIVGIVGVLIGRRNLILVIICLELMLLAATYHYLLIGWGIYGDILSVILSIFILTIGACESAIGLALTIAFFKEKYKTF